jgi:hypothetical protein
MVEEWEKQVVEALVGNFYTHFGARHVPSLDYERKQNIFATCSNIETQT